MIRILFFLLALLGFSCQDNVLYEPEFSGAKLVVNGLLRANQPPEVYVGRTWPATGAIPEKTFVDNAVVSLYANGILAGQLSYWSEGNYRLANYTLKVGVSYVIKVEASGFDPAQSKPVSIPKPFPLQQLKFDTVANLTSPNRYGMPRLLRIQLNDYPEAGNYYGIGVLPYQNEEPGGGGYVLPIERALGGFNYRDDDCFKQIALISLLAEVEKPKYGRGDVTIYSDGCFAQSEKELGIVVETLTFVRINNGILVSTPEDYIDRLEIFMFSVSPEYFEYGKTYQIVEGLNNAFTEPKRTYTNVTGGYGIVAALNESRQTIHLR